MLPEMQVYTQSGDYQNGVNLERASKLGFVLLIVDRICKFVLTLGDD
jgi:hypothetical protein